jgi:hypothetical protein
MNENPPNKNPMISMGSKSHVQYQAHTSPERLDEKQKYDPKAIAMKHLT